MEKATDKKTLLSREGLEKCSMGGGPLTFMVTAFVRHGLAVGVEEFQGREQGATVSIYTNERSTVRCVHCSVATIPCHWVQTGKWGRHPLPTRGPAVGGTAERP